MVLALRGALRTALGASLSVSHTCTDNVVRNVTVPIVDQGTVAGEETPFPVVQFVGAVGNTENTDIGGGSVHNEDYVDLHILVNEDPNGLYNAPRLVEDVYAALVSAINAVRKSVGSSYFTLATHYRDFPPRQTEAAPYWWTRYVMVRGENLETL